MNTNLPRIETGIGGWHVYTMVGIGRKGHNHRFFREITISDFLRFRNTVQLYTQPEKSFLGLKRGKNWI